METEVQLIEFFCSFQGEGVDAGQAMVILRFKTCNRIESGRGCPWCDTAVRLRISQPFKLSLSEIQKVVTKNKCGLLITGGCPTFSTNFDQTVDLLNKINYSIANVESNGYRLPQLIEKVDPTKNVHYMYSPKIFTETEFQEELIRTKKLKKYEKVFVKVVFEDRSLIIKYLEFLSKLDINQRVFLMPEGDTREKLIEHSSKVFDACERYKFNFSSRTHIIYGFV